MDGVRTELICIGGLGYKFCKILWDLDFPKNERGVEMNVGANNLYLYGEFVHFVEQFIFLFFPGLSFIVALKITKEDAT